VPIAEDLRTIANRALGELDAVHDFYVHSLYVWQSFAKVVKSGEAAAVENPATGSTTEGPALLALAPRYARQYLATFTFRQFISTFESFFFAFYFRVLQHNPRPFGRTQLDFDTVLKARDRDEIIAGVLMKQLNEVKYENVREWFAALNRTVKLGCPTDDEADTFAEIKATRDVLEHNAGYANDTYLRKAGKKARFANGEFIELDDDYHLESWRLVRKVVSDLATAAAA
jgi:hypothetical protein